MKIYTKRGDKGETGLLYGGRVRKTDARVNAYGTLDEAVSFMGMARAICSDEEVAGYIIRVQREMFTVGAELATDSDSLDLLRKHFTTVTPEMTRRLEADIDALGERVDLPRAFIIPGGSPLSAALDAARSTVRRAERATVGLYDAEQLENKEILRYLNRLADFLFMLARFVDRDRPPEVLTGDSKG